MFRLGRAVVGRRALPQQPNQRVVEVSNQKLCHDRCPTCYHSR